MNRRDFISSVTVSGCIGVAGCSRLNTKPNNSSNGETPTESVSTSDNSRTETPVESTAETRYLSKLFSLANINQIRGTESGQNLQSLNSGFISYSADSVTISIQDELLNSNSLRPLVVLREFPRGDVISSSVGEHIEGSSEYILSITSDERIEPVYYTLFLVPAEVDIVDLAESDLNYIHETNPFRVNEKDNIFEYSDFPISENVITDNMSRRKIEGGYLVEVSSRTQGKDWSFSYFCSQSSYVEKATAPRGRDLVEYASVEVGSGISTFLSDIIDDTARSIGITSESEKTQLAVDFVQSLPYIKDSIGTGYDEYPKFIEETLVELEGDCEDSTILLGSILGTMGLDVVFVTFPGHVGVGVNGDYSGSYISYEDSEYYYIETTGRGWSVGDFPETLSTDSVTVQSI